MLITSFFTFSTSSLDLVTGYMGDLFSDISPLVLLIIGVSLAMIVLAGIISAIRGH